MPEYCQGQFFYAGELLDYSGPLAPEGFTLPEGMEIKPWEHPRFFWLTFKGKPIAGPARREVLESFAYQEFRCGSDER